MGCADMGEWLKETNERDINTSDALAIGWAHSDGLAVLSPLIADLANSLISQLFAVLTRVRRGV
jgi:hypothetical protein